MYEDGNIIHIHITKYILLYSPRYTYTNVRVHPIPENAEVGPLFIDFDDTY